MKRQKTITRFTKLAMLIAPILCGLSACTSMDIQNAMRAGITSSLNSIFGTFSSAVANGLVG